MLTLLSKTQFSKAKGLTLAEVIIALVLLAVLATILLPPQLINTGEAKLLNQAKEVASELSLAYISLANLADTTDATTTADVIARANYVRIVNNGSQSIQVRFRVADGQPDQGCDSTSGVLCISTCTATKPCLVMQNGGLLQYDADANFNAITFPAPPPPPYNRYALRFLFDPDGSTPIQTASVFYLFFGGRVSTEQNIDRTLVTDTDNVTPRYTSTGVAIRDPEYIFSWTQEASAGATGSGNLGEPP